MTDKFREIITKLDPEKNVITEDVQNELVTMMGEKEKAIREVAYAKALKVVNKKLQQMDEEHAEKLREIVEKVKENYEKKLEDMDSDHTEKLQKIVEHIDKDHTQKVKQIVEAIDEDHTNKLKTLVESIDNDHSSKLQKIVEHFESKKINDQMVEAVSDYLDVYLEKVMPEKTLVNEAKLRRLERFHEQVREIAMVNDDFVQTEIREAVEDAASQIKGKEEEIDKLMLEKVELSNKIKKFEAKQLLSEKCKDLSPKLLAYVQTRFEDADSEEIEEQFNEAVKAFKIEETAKRKRLVEQADTMAKIRNPKPINEDISNKKPLIEEVDSNMSRYIHVLNKSNKK